jgi:hypothetical protein
MNGWIVHGHHHEIAVALFIYITSVDLSLVPSGLSH